ncbi:hypothetical protein EHQ58_18545 [Leptospira ognonensis]|uniref:Uncharacterized protein n=1 Tax=Leptospira ognonensis TaxID=2484945 RepID=A0A4R9JVA9_9LEPT|nr:hypothetical protein [Leptospira ognonensis]TGL55337.1 hypothetical protein EHQ58_18545 [Leptospira ognonensis]
MNWLNTKYKCFLFLGDPSENNLWEFSNWDKFSTKISSFLDNDINSLTVRVSQISLKDNKYLKFGRLKLDNRSNAKWTHNSPFTKELSDEWLFESGEGWLPSWTKCQNLDKSPDFFFSIINEKSHRLTRPVTFNPILLMSFSLEKYSQESILNLILSLKEDTKPILIVEQERYWGIQSGTGFTYAMNDLTLTHLFKKDQHGKPIDLGNFEEEWRLFKS